MTKFLSQMIFPPPHSTDRGGGGGVCVMKSMNFRSRFVGNGKGILDLYRGGGDARGGRGKGSSRENIRPWRCFDRRAPTGGAIERPAGAIKV